MLCSVIPGHSLVRVWGGESSPYAKLMSVYSIIPSCRQRVIHQMEKYAISDKTELDKDIS